MSSRYGNCNAGDTREATCCSNARLLQDGFDWNKFAKGALETARARFSSLCCGSYVSFVVNRKCLRRRFGHG